MGMQTGLSMTEALDLPIGELQDLTTIYLISACDWTYRPPETEDDFWRLLERK